MNKRFAHLKRKKCLVSLVIRKMQIKTAVRYYFTSVKDKTEVLTRV